jgi:hypothetical protein
MRNSARKLRLLSATIKNGDVENENSVNQIKSTVESITEYIKSSRTKNMKD